MVFINEYVSEEDIQKYKLDDLWNQWVFKDTDIKMPEYRSDGLFKYNWSINRPDNSWLMKLRSLPIFDEAVGLKVQGPDSLFLFSSENKLYEIILTLCEGSTVSIYDHPYNTIWKLKDIRSLNSSQKISAELIKELTYAVQCYGRAGVQTRVENNLVELIWE